MGFGSLGVAQGIMRGWWKMGFESDADEMGYEKSLL